MAYPSDKNTPALMLATGMFLSGTVGVFAVASGQPTVNVVLFRCLFGAMCLFGWAFVTGGTRGLRDIGRTNWLLIATSGILLVLNWLTLFEAFRRTSIGFATIVYHLQPFWIVLAASVILKERLSGGRLQWISLGFAGLVLTVLPRLGGMRADPDWLMGLGFAFVASMLYAGATLTTRAVRGVEPAVLSGLHCLIGVALFAPFLNASALSDAGSATWAALGTIGVIHTGLVYVLIYSAYPRLPVATIAVGAFLNPAAALLTDYLAFGRVLTPLQAFGFLLILVAGLAINMGWNGLRGPGRART